MQDARARRDYDRRYELAALDKLRSMGVNLIPVELPKLPWDAMVPLLTAEAAAAFDDLTMTGRDRLLTEQGIEDWPNDFRVARFYPAVEYIQANRARTLAIRQLSALFEQVDIIVTPSTDTQLIATNLTGNPGAHPAQRPARRRRAPAARHRRRRPRRYRRAGHAGFAYVPRRPLPGREAGRLRPRLSGGDGLPQAAPQAGLSERPKQKLSPPAHSPSGHAQSASSRKDTFAEARHAPSAFFTVLAETLERLQHARTDGELELCTCRIDHSQLDISKCFCR